MMKPILLMLRSNGEQARKTDHQKSRRNHANAEIFDGEADNQPVHHIERECDRCEILDRPRPETKVEPRELRGEDARGEQASE